MLKKLLLIVVVALVIGVIAHYLKWFQGRLALSILVAFIGAILGFLVYWALDKHPVELLTRPLAIVSTVVGSAIVGYVVSNFVYAPQVNLPPRIVSVWIDCDGNDGPGSGDYSGPEVYSNYIAVLPNDTVRFRSNQRSDYKIDFVNSVSPFPSATYTVPMNQDLSVVVKSTALANGYQYKIKCPSTSGSYLTVPHIPMIQIPRQY